MVKGLDTFKRYFADYTDCYILIGGSACDVNFSAAALPFRVTHDLDMVLCVEALTPSFFKRFWSFVHEGGYVHREKSNGERQFYRFTHPTHRIIPTCWNCSPAEQMSSLLTQLDISRRFSSVRRRLVSLASC